jgi:putative tryptophan/tyrosine transport system substrate-binding protein
MKRREFIAALGGAATWPLVARAAGEAPTCGGAYTPLAARQRRSDSRLCHRYARTGLHSWPDSRFRLSLCLRRDRTTAAVGTGADCTSPDVIFASEPSSARAVKALAPDLPIVCSVLSDRLSDLFASYARPGGSVTGVASMLEDLNKKLVDLAHEAVPGLKLVGLLVNPSGANHGWFAEQIEAAARARGVTTHGEGWRTGRARSTKRNVHQSARDNHRTSACRWAADHL